MAERLREVPVEVAERKRPPFLIDVLIRMVKEKPLGVIGGIIVVLLLFFGIFADLIAPYGMNEIHLADRLDGPNTQYWLGTDNLGRCVLSRIVYGARVSMFIGFGATIISQILAISLGGTSGYLGGKFDLVVQRFVDAFMSFPRLFVLLTVMAIVGGGLVNVLIVLGVTTGIRASRIMRSATIAIKNNVYVEAARAVGCSTVRLLLVHILPNIVPVILISFSVEVGGMILQEASLSFLGFGIEPPTPSWGGMLSGSGRQFMLVAPWMMVWPGVALSLVIYGTNMLGDAIRDLVDPRLRGGLGRFGGMSQEQLQKMIEKKSAK